MVSVPPGELDAATSQGARIRVIEPDRIGRPALGTNLMQASAAFDAVETGLRQGTHVAAVVRRFWEEDRGW
jgi:hypothetical protein